MQLSQIIDFWQHVGGAVCSGLDRWLLYWLWAAHSVQIFSQKLGRRIELLILDCVCQMFRSNFIWKTPFLSVFLHVTRTWGVILVNTFAVFCLGLFCESWVTPGRRGFCWFRAEEDLGQERVSSDWGDTRPSGEGSAGNRSPSPVNVVVSRPAPRFALACTNHLKSQ